MKLVNFITGLKTYGLANHVDVEFDPTEFGYKYHSARATASGLRILVRSVPSGLRFFLEGKQLVLVNRENITSIIPDYHVDPYALPVVAIEPKEVHKGVHNARLQLPSNTLLEKQEIVGALFVLSTHGVISSAFVPGLDSISVKQLYPVVQEYFTLLDTDDGVILTCQ